MVVFSVSVSNKQCNIGFKSCFSKLETQVRRKPNRKLTFKCCSSLFNTTRRGMMIQGGICGCGCSLKNLQDQFFAYNMAHGMDRYENTLAAIKTNLFQEIKNSKQPITVLEVGIGTAPNIKYYANEQVCVIGVDPNPQMVPYAQESMYRFGLQDNLDIRKGVVESLPVDDASIDYVIATLVFCSVKDIVKSLKEIQRVTKPGGKFFFIEHVISPKDDSIRKIQKFLNPLQQLFADGCHLDRDTLKYIDDAGFMSINAQRLFLEELQYLAPHISGYAVI